MRRKSLQQRLFEFIGGGMLAAGAIWLGTLWGPSIEGELMPVTSHTKIDSVESAGHYKSIIRGSFVRLRDCKFLRLVWAYGERDGPFVVVPHEFLAGAKIRDLGQQEFGPWKLYIASGLVDETTFADAYHQCHSLWETKTRFWR